MFVTPSLYSVFAVVILIFSIPLHAAREAVAAASHFSTFNHVPSPTHWVSNRGSLISFSPKPPDKRKRKHTKTKQKVHSSQAHPAPPPLRRALTPSRPPPPSSFPSWATVVPSSRGGLAPRSRLGRSDLPSHCSCPADPAGEVSPLVPHMWVGRGMVGRGQPVVSALSAAAPLLWLFI